MNTFDYLATLISIILGLSITHLLTSVYKLIEGHNRVKFHWLPLLWAILIFLAIIQWWWGLYGLYKKEDWNFFSYVFTLITPVTMYLTASLVLPNIETDKNYDLHSHYFKNHRWFFSLAAVNPFFDALRSYIFSGHLFTTSRLINILGALLFISMAILKNERFHIIMTIILSTIFFSYIFAISLKF